MKSILKIVIALLLAGFVGCTRESAVEPGSSDDPIAQAEIDYDLGEYVECMKTIQDYILSVQKGDNAEKPDIMTRAYKLLGNVYYMYADRTSARGYYEKALTYAEQLDDRTEQLKVLHNLSLLCCGDKQQNMARDYANRIMHVTQAPDNLRKYFHTYSLGTIERNFGSIDKAIKLYDEAIALVDDKIVPEHLKASPMYEKATALHQTGRLQEALLALKAIEDYFKTSIAHPSIRVSVMHEYMKIYEETGDSDQAAIYQRKYMAMSDSLMNQNRFMKSRGAFNMQQAELDHGKMDTMRHSLSLLEVILITLATVAVTGIIFMTVIRLRNRRAKAKVALPVKDNADKSTVSEQQFPKREETAKESDEAAEQRIHTVFETISKIASDPAFFCSPTASLEEMAQLASTNVKYVSQAVNEFAGVNFRTFINNFRVRHACRLIEENPAISAAELGDKVGFQSPSAFIAAFRKFTGKTPSLYIRAVRNGALLKKGARAEA